MSELENDLSRGVGEREHIKNELMDCQVQKSMLEAALSHQHDKTFTAQQSLHQARIFGKTVYLLTIHNVPLTMVLFFMSKWSYLSERQQLRTLKTKAEEQLHAAQGLLAKSKKECQQLQKALSLLSCVGIFSKPQPPKHTSSQGPASMSCSLLALGCCCMNKGCNKYC